MHHYLYSFCITILCSNDAWNEFHWIIKITFNNSQKINFRVTSVSRLRARINRHLALKSQCSVIGNNCITPQSVSVALDPPFTHCFATIIVSYDILNLSYIKKYLFAWYWLFQWRSNLCFCMTSHLDYFNEGQHCVFCMTLTISMKVNIVYFAWPWLFQWRSTFCILYDHAYFNCMTFTIQMKVRLMFLHNLDNFNFN